MDYEKKYKEALAMAREIIKESEIRGLKDNLFYTKEDFEAIFPELKESEDERIRKALITFFQRFPYDSIESAGTNPKEAIAWLEKQKECSDTDSNTENEYTKVYKWLKKNKDRYVHNLGTCGESRIVVTR